MSVEQRPAVYGANTSLQRPNVRDDGMKPKKTAVILILLAILTINGATAEDLTGTYYQITADFNADGIPDLALSTTRNHFGNAGGVFTFYTGTTNGDFTPIGSIFMHPLAANLAETRLGEGLLTVFVRGGHEGALISYAITSEGIVERHRRSLLARDGGPKKDRDIYKSFFDDAVRLKAELKEGNSEPPGGAYVSPAAGDPSAHP